MSVLRYPFSAIVGQELLKTALLVCAANPSAGGLLVRGDKGSAKSTAARGLSQLLPPIQVVAGCQFNCEPEKPQNCCHICSQADRVIQTRDVPFITLPLGATEDRLLGSLDFEKSLKQGVRAFQPGILAAAHRGILYIDEVNLLPDHLVDVLLDVAAMGINSVEREGCSIEHQSRFTLIGTMNPEEGDLRPQLLDRFAMMLDIQSLGDATSRAQIVKRRIRFETDETGFSSDWQEQQTAVQIRLVEATKLLMETALTDSQVDLISQICCQAKVATLRADISMHKVSQTIASLNGHVQVSLDDIKTAAHLVLPHRRRQQPFDRTDSGQKSLNDILNEASENDNSLTDDEETEENEQPQSNSDHNQKQDLSEPSEQNPVPNQGQHSDDFEHELAQDEDDNDHRPPRTEEQTSGQSSADEQKTVVPPQVTTGNKVIRLQDVNPVQLTGKRVTASQSNSGRTVTTSKNANPQSLAITATLRHSIGRNGGTLQVEREDLHENIKFEKSACLILFVVDTSGSMSAMKRMELTKGCVINLLQDAYVKRDRVAVITFSGSEASLVLPPTRSIDLAVEKLAGLPGGGRTPLSHALRLVQKTVTNQRTQVGKPLMILLSDCKANLSLDAEADPWQESLSIAREIATTGLPCIVADTESGFIRLGRSKEIASALQATYLTIEEMESDQLTVTIKSALAHSRKQAGG